MLPIGLLLVVLLHAREDDLFLQLTLFRLFVEALYVVLTEASMMLCLQSLV